MAMSRVTTPNLRAPCGSCIMWRPTGVLIWRRNRRGDWMSYTRAYPGPHQKDLGSAPWSKLAEWVSGGRVRPCSGTYPSPALPLALVPRLPGPCLGRRSLFPVLRLVRLQGLVIGGWAAVQAPGDSYRRCDETSEGGSAGNVNFSVAYLPLSRRQPN